MNRETLDNTPSRLMMICFISHSSWLGGAEKALLELVTTLKEKDVYSVVVVPSHGLLSEELDKAGIDFITSKYWWWVSKDSVLWKRIARTILNLFTPIAIAYKVKRYNVNIVCSNTLTISVGMVVAKLLGIPHIYFIHEFGKENQGLQFDLGQNISLNLMNKFSAGIICNSKAVANKFSKYFDRDKLFVVYQSASVEPFKYNPEEQSKIKASTNCLCCVIVGTLQEGKRQEDAILAVLELKNKGLNVFLEIVGDGDLKYKSYLFNLVKENNLEDCVHFNGFVNPPFSIISKCDVLLMCSEYEAFGRVTVEAMLLGKPIVGAKSGGTLELVKDGFNGLLYTTGDYHELAEKIEYIYYHRDEAINMGLNGYYWAKDLFTKDKYAEGFIEAIDYFKLSKQLKL